MMLGSKAFDPDIIIITERYLAMKFVLETPRLELRVLNDLYAPEVLQFLEQNRNIFEPVEAPKPIGFYTLNYQRESLRAEGQAFLQNRYIRYYVFCKNLPDRIIGTVSFSSMIPFPYDSAVVGYKFDPAFQHKGYATEAITCACHALFSESNVHRIEAYVLPDNIPSQNLLERIGFEFEGISRSVINIHGSYKDHQRYALISEK